MKTLINFTCLVALILLWSGLAMAQPEVLWQKTYGGFDSDVATAICPAPDGGALLVGYSKSFEAVDYQGWVVRVDRDGDTLWTRAYGYTNDNFFCKVLPHQDGYLIFGAIGEDSLWTVVINDDGEVLRENLGHPDYEVLQEWKIVQFPNGEIQSVSAFWGWCMIARFNENGVLLWSKRVRSKTSGFDLLTSITPEGDILVAGEVIRDVGGGDYQVRVLKFTPLGDTLWTREYGGRWSDEVHHIVTLNDGRILVSGKSPTVEDANGYGWLLLLSADGEVIRENHDGEGYQYIAIGESDLLQVDQTLKRLNDLMEERWSVDLPKSPYPVTVASTDEGGMFLFGAIPDNHGDYSLTKISPDPFNGVHFWRVIADTLFREDQELTIEQEYLLAHVGVGEYPLDSLRLTSDPAEQCETFWEGGQLIITPPEDWFGKDKIRLIATDPKNRSVSTYLHITCVSVNDPPEPFTLRAPADSVSLNNPMVVFVWNEATQNQYETDSVSYALSLKVGVKVHTFPRMMERTLVIDDLMTTIDEMGFGNGDPVGMVEWWVTAYDSEDSTESTQRYHLNIDQIMAQREIQAPLPTDLAIASIYPNPFNSTTTISYSVNQSGVTRMDVLDINGRHWATLVDGVKSAGHYSVNWSAGNIPTGLYILRLEAGGVARTAKMVLVK